jgi:SpoIIAA-like
MPLGYDIYTDIGLLYIRGQGEITQRQYMNTMLAWLREPEYENCTEALIDFADVTNTPSVGELRELIAMLKQEIPARGPRRAAVVTSRPITFAIARTFGDLVRSRELPLDVKVFMSVGAAWAWLRPDEPPFQLR